jgi:serine/threonine protein phosphatase PrpC
MLSKAGSRPENQDCVAAGERPDGRLFVLCDGLGGHGRGDAASTMASQAALAAFEGDGAAGETLLRACVQAAQQALVGEQLRTGRMDQLKTTIVLLHLTETTARWAHIGDSRLYVYYGERLLARTLDHSVPQQLVIRGALDAGDIRFHPERNRLTHVLGVAWDAPRPVVSDEVALMRPMSFLLCSDGFWELIDEAGMSGLLAAGRTPADWLKQMERVVRRGGRIRPMDNYSAIAVYVR